MLCTYRQFGHFVFDLIECYCQYQQTDSDTENYWSVWRQTHYDITNKNNNVNSEDLDITLSLVSHLVLSDLLQY